MPIRRPSGGRISASCSSRSRPASRARAPRRGRDGADAGDRLEPRGRADRARPAPRDRGGRASSGRVGRPAQTLELGDRIVAIGLEVNVDYLAVCVEDLTGDGSLRAARPHGNRRSSPRPVLDRLGADGGPGARGGVDQRGLVAAGVAVALPGLVEAQTGTLLRAPNLGWSEIPVADEIAAGSPGCRCTRRERGEPRRAR